MALKSRFFQGNREKLCQNVGKGLIVVTANGLMQRSGDTVYSFRQDSNFYYLTGVIEPDIILVVDSVNSEEFLILPKKTHAEEVFGGVTDSRAMTDMSGIQTIMNYKEGWAHLKELQKSRKKIYTILAPPTKVTHTDNFFTNGNRRRLIEKLKRNDSKSNIVDIRSKLTSLRQIKQIVEIESIKQAIDITSQGITKARQKIAPGASGFALKAELDYVFTSAGVEHGFTPILISGADTCILHSNNLRRTISAGGPVLFDVGAECSLYSADISRTFFSSSPTKRQKEVYEAVMRVHAFALQLIRPGLAWREYVNSVNQEMGKQLINLGLINESTPQNIRTYFPHAVSHSLGLDVHDVCDYTTIQENMVITVEPGIYIPEEALGVRIEDDVLVTKNGAVNLSAFVSYQ